MSLPTSRRRAGRTLLAAALLTGLIALAPAAAPQQSTRPAKGEEVALSLSGSHSLTDRLAPALLAEFALDRGAKGLNWRPLDNTGQTWALSFRNAPQNGPSYAEMRAVAPSTAFEQITSGVANLAISSRMIADKEIISHAMMGDWASSRSEHFVGLDGLAIIVHPSNRITALTPADIRRIFSGEVRNWSQLGGLDVPVTLFAPPPSSSAGDALASIVLKRAQPAANLVRRADDRDVIAAVAGDFGGVGAVSTIAPPESVRSLEVKVCGFSHRPNEFSIRSEEYPFTRRLYLYTPQRARSPLVEQFAAFVRSAAGERVVEEEGFIGTGFALAGANSPYRLERERAGIRAMQRPEILRDYLLAIERAQQVSKVVRFRPSSNELDEQALSDFPLLGRYLSAPEMASRKVYVFGFSDGKGEYDENIALAKRRAEVVATRLAAYGVKAARVEGFGEEAPLGCGADEYGEGINRRVEIWVE